MGRMRITPISMVIVDNYVLHRDEPSKRGGGDTTPMLETIIHNCLEAVSRIIGRKRG